MRNRHVTIVTIVTTVTTVTCLLEALAADSSHQRMPPLLENQLGKVIQSVFPDNKVVLPFRVFNQRAGHTILVAKRLQTRINDTP